MARTDREFDLCEPGDPESHRSACGATENMPDRAFAAVVRCPVGGTEPGSGQCPDADRATYTGRAHADGTDDDADRDTPDPWVVECLAAEVRRFLEPGPPLAVEVRFVHGVGDDVVVVVGGAAFDGVDRQESAEYRALGAGAHLDQSERAGMFEKPLVLSEPAVVHLAGLVVRDVVVVDGPGGVQWLAVGRVGP